MSVQPVETASERLECFAPGTGQRIGSVPVSSPEQVRAAVARSREVQQADWSKRTLAQRIEVMQVFADLLIERSAELCALLSLECGKPESEAYIAEVLTAIDLTRYYAKLAPKLLRRKYIPLHLLIHRTSYVHYTPKGVIGIIAPWNFPFIIPFGDVIIALMTGNGVVVKPSEETPLVALKGLELLLEAGVPEGLVEVVCGWGPTGAALCTSGVDKVVFTGSVATGKRVAVACAEQLIPVTLELGGKAPAVVLPSANVERAARGLVYGAYVNSGQICVSVERVYVHRSMHDELVGRIVERVNKLRHGDPQADEVDVGCVISSNQIAIAQRQIAQAVEAGAQVAAGGKTPDMPGQFFEPTVLTGVNNQMDVARTETFGPLMPIIVYDTVEEAIELANDTHLGLMAYVFAGTAAEGRAVAEQIEAGTVMVNDVLTTYAAPETPWRGMKKSGLGVVHGDGGMLAMCEARHVHSQWVPHLSNEIWWYPIRDGFYDFVLRAIRLVHGRGFKRLSHTSVKPRTIDPMTVLPERCES